jgi:hypothetical protein
MTAAFLAWQQLPQLAAAFPNWPQLSITGSNFPQLAEAFLNWPDISSCALTS